jgi:hypothetical protein
MTIYVPEARDEASFVAVLDRLGSVSAWCKVSQFDGHAPSRDPSAASNARDEQQMQDVQKIRELVLTWRPRVIAVSIVQRAFRARPVYAALRGDNSLVLGPLLEQLRSSLPGVVPKVLFLDGRVSRCFGLGPMAASEMSSFPAALRSAVSLGRVVLDPLME